MDTDVASLLKDVGLRATPKRAALLESLTKAATPLTAEELHRKIRGMNLVTVYRNLQSLSEAGLVRLVRFNDNIVRYESAGHGHHHHLVCNSCGTIEDIAFCPAATIEEEALRASKRFASIKTHAFELFGTCDTCIKK